MSSWLAVTAGLALAKKRDSSIEPLRREIERVERDQQDALRKLELATKDLVEALVIRPNNEH